jgi:hypothetical protein
LIPFGNYSRLPHLQEDRMSDIVKQLLFRSSDEAGIGWTPTTVVHVPAGLLHQAADEIARLTAVRAECERQFQEKVQEIITLTARVAELEGALQAWEDAVRIDVVMEGPRYIGVDYRRGFIAWEKTLAALTQPAPERTA